MRRTVSARRALDFTGTVMAAGIHETPSRSSLSRRRASICASDLKTAPVRLSLQMVNDTPGERCARSEASDPAPPVTVSLHRTFHDDFDEHPLLSGRWVSHCAGAVSLPESFYAGGEGSDLRRKTKYNGEQQIYVDPGYEGARDGPARSRPVQGSRWRVVDCREPDTFRSQGGVVQQ